MKSFLRLYKPIPNNRFKDALKNSSLNFSPQAKLGACPRFAYKINHFECD